MHFLRFLEKPDIIFSFCLLLTFLWSLHYRAGLGRQCVENWPFGVPKNILVNNNLHTYDATEYIADLEKKDNKMIQK